MVQGARRCPRAGEAMSHRIMGALGAGLLLGVLSVHLGGDFKLCAGTGFGFIIAALVRFLEKTATGGKP